MTRCDCPFDNCPARTITSARTATLALTHALRTEGTPRAVLTLAQVTTALESAQAELIAAHWLGGLPSANDVTFSALDAHNARR